MPIIRNPFKKSAGDPYYNDDSTVPVNGLAAGYVASTPDPGFQKQGLWGSFSSKPVKVPAHGTEKHPAEYKLSEIDDSGVFVPPSPPERQASFWGTSRSTASRTSSYRSVSVVNENEPFSISRESFDSYRRSFDISARSPVTLGAPSSPVPRQSLDFRQIRYQVPSHSPTMPRMSPPRLPDLSLPPLKDNHVHPPASLEEDIDGESEESDDKPNVSTAGTSPEDPIFEDVGLNDEKKPVKKRGFFSRFGESSSHSHNHTEDVPRPGSKDGHGHSLGISIFGRKRGASGQGAELGQIPPPSTNAGPSPLGITGIN